MDTSKKPKHIKVDMVAIKKAQAAEAKAKRLFDSATEGVDMSDPEKGMAAVMEFAKQLHGGKK